MDRIPISPRIASGVVYEFFQTHDIDLVEGTVLFCRHFGFDVMDWNCTPPFDEFIVEGPSWKPDIRCVTAGNTTHEIVTVETPRGSLQQVRAITQTSPWEVETALIEFPIKTPRDFELLAEYQPPMPDIDSHGLFQAREYIGDDGIITPSIHGAFNTLAYYYRKLDDLLLDIVERPDFYDQMIRHFMNRRQKYIQQLIDVRPLLIDVGVNIANSRMVSPAFWVEYVLPYENALADFIQDQGVSCLFHNCGYASAHMDLYHRIHHRGWGYLTPPPHGDTDFAKAIEILPSTMLLWGNIDQVDFLRQASPHEVEQRVREVLDMVKNRGHFILGTSDHLEVNTPVANLHAFVRAGRRFGTYA